MCVHVPFVTLGGDLQNRPGELVMDAIVVYESVFGNTRAIADAVAEGLGSVPALPVYDAAEHRGTVDLLVVGGPTHMHGLPTTRSRRLAAEGVREDGTGHVEPGATEEPGLRSGSATFHRTRRSASRRSTRARQVTLADRRRRAGHRA